MYFTTVAFLPLLQATLHHALPPAQHNTNTNTNTNTSQSHHLSPSVIVISSMSGIMRHAQGHFSYNAAKGATVHLAKLMSAEFQKNGIRVNSIAPGHFPTEMTTQDSDGANKSSMPPEKIQEKGYVPAQRPGEDEEIGQAVLFLAKNRYVNGEILAVDGGVLNVVGGR